MIHSEWEAVPAGVPQGTKLVPWLFLIMINDLSVADTTLWKYIDDTTLVESLSKNETSYMQLRVDELVRQSEADGFQLNKSKFKEVRISFSRSGSSVDLITINDKQIEVVSSTKLLRVVVLDNLRWNAHIYIYIFWKPCKTGFYHFTVLHAVLGLVKFVFSIEGVRCEEAELHCRSLVTGDNTSNTIW